MRSSNRLFDLSDEGRSMGAAFGLAVIAHTWLLGPLQFLYLRPLSQRQGSASYALFGGYSESFRERAACQGGQLPLGNCLPNYAVKSRNHRMGLIILILVILLLIGAFPTGGYGYGYRSHGIIGTILIIVLILYLLGRL